jgi:large subunit ribosomal protein L22
MVKVFLKSLNIPPRKVNLVAKMIRGLKASEAERQLLFSSKRASKSLLKLLRSAFDIAEKQKQLKKEELKIAKLVVNQGPKRKRYRAMSRSHVGTITKRSSHIELELTKV